MTQPQASFSNYEPVGEYRPVGWIQWPDHPDFSFQFLRVLAESQEGAATISECFLAGTRITPNDEESWHREWTRLGDVNRKRADTAIAGNHVQTAKMNWLRAANYYRSAEFFLDHDDPRRLQLLDAMEACSWEYMKRMAPPGEIVRVPYENGAHLDAYFIRAPYKLARQPTVICFGGLDEFRVELLHEMPKHAFPRGFSVLLVDLPGQGSTLRRQKLTARSDSEIPVSACVDYLVSRPDVDSKRIALYGSSLGGYYAPRAAAFDHRLAAVVSYGQMWNLQRTLQMGNFTPDRIAIRHLHWVFGVDGQGTEEGLNAIEEKCGEFKLEGVIENMRCPYLITAGECDHVALELTRESFEYCQAHGMDVELKVFTAEETGAAHCQCDNPTFGKEYVCDWLADKLDIDQPELPADLLKPWT